MAGRGCGLCSEEAWRTLASYLGEGGPRGQHTPCFLGAVLDWPYLPMGQGGQLELQELPAGKWETQVTLQLGQRRLWGLTVGRVCSGSRIPSSQSATPSLGPSGP